MSEPLIYCVPLTDDRLDLAMRIEGECFPLDPWSEHTVRMMANAEGNDFLLWYRENGATPDLIGSAVYLATEYEAELYKIAVLPEHRGKGYGDIMLRKMLKKAKASGSPAVFLEVREGNLAARRLYEKNGFVTDGIRKSYYKSPTENAVLMSIDLSKYERS